MGAHFTSVPVEIADHIAKLLVRSDCLRLMKTCKFLHAIGLPVLYQNAYFDCIEFEVSDNNFRRLYPGIYNFTCSVLGNSEVAASVRSLNIHDLTNGEPTNHSITPLEHVDDNVQQAVENMRAAVPENVSGTNGQNSWLGRISSLRDSEATLAILLPHLPNLERLHVALAPYSTRLCNAVLRGAASLRLLPSYSAFNALKHVELDVTLNLMGWDGISVVLGLPSIQKLHLKERADGSFREYDKVPFGDVEPKSSSVSKISINVDVAESEQDLGLENVRKVIETCQELRSFKLVWQFIESPGFNYLDRVLESAQHTLEKLKLYYEGSPELKLYYEGPYFDEESDVPPLETLAEFSKLKELTIGMIFLFGLYNSKRLIHGLGPELLSLPESPFPVDCLLSNMPLNLELLRLVRHTNENFLALYQNVNAVLEAMECGGFTSLKRIVVDQRTCLEYIDHYETMSEDQETLQEDQETLQEDQETTQEDQETTQEYQPHQREIEEKLGELGLRAAMLGVRFEWSTVRGLDWEYIIRD